MSTKGHGHFGHVISGHVGIHQGECKHVGERKRERGGYGHHGHFGPLRKIAPDMESYTH
jgi:hypothetical protein